jgi:hypothetical protein
MKAMEFLVAKRKEADAEKELKNDEVQEGLHASRRKYKNWEIKGRYEKGNGRRENNEHWHEHPFLQATTILWKATGWNACKMSPLVIFCSVS